MVTEHGWPGWPGDDPAGHGPDGPPPQQHDPVSPDGADPHWPAHDWPAHDWPGQDGAAPREWAVGEDPGHQPWDGHDPDASDASASDAHPAAALSDTHDTVPHPDPAHPDKPGHDDDPGYPDDPAHHDGSSAEPAGHEMGAVGTDPDAVTHPAADPVDLFAPPVDVGALPEPVDGFPWIDTASLGVVPTDGHDGAPGAPDPAELAEYAAADLPPGVDPWAHLAASDDPATSALARFWHPDA